MLKKAMMAFFNRQTSPRQLVVRSLIHPRWSLANPAKFRQSFQPELVLNAADQPSDVIAP